MGRIRWVSVLWIALAVCPSLAYAQLLTQQQCLTLSTDALVTHETEFAEIIAAGAANQLAAAYNLAQAPSYLVWKTTLTPAEYRSGIVWAEVDALSVGDARIFEWVTGQLLSPINPADPNIRQGLADAFAPGTATRANLLALAQRPALRGERLYATGTGSSQAPGTLTYEGMITTEDAGRAMQHPTTQRCNELGS